MLGLYPRTPLLLTLFSLLLGTAAPAMGREELPTQDEIPYGVAADYLIGRQLMKEGQFAEALGYLHLVYRTHPDVPAIAEDFQEALVAEGYFKDALAVMNGLVATYPDSLGYLLQRSHLNLQLGDTEAALADLQTIRNEGGANLDVIIAEANLRAAQGDLNQALDVFRDGIHLFPDLGDRMYLGMAALLQRAERNDDIVPLLEEALKAYPDSPELWLAQVRSLAAVGKHEKALDLARTAEARFRALAAVPPPAALPEEDTVSPPAAAAAPQLPESFLVDLADFYVQRGEVERGVSILRPLSEAGTLELGPSLWLTRIYLGTGQQDRATKLLERVLATWPDAGRAWFLKGKLREAAEDWPGAVPLFKRASELAPYDGEIRLALVRSMLVGWEKDLSADSPNADQRAKRDALEKEAVVALTLVPGQDADGQLVLGYVFRALDDPWRAEACLELAAVDQELRIPALTQRSICLDEMGEPGKAQVVLENLLKEFPDNPEVTNSLGYFLAEKGEDLERAEKLIRIALTAEPGNGAFLDSMGWVLHRLGRSEAALDYMIQAVNVLPDDPVILEHLGMVLLSLGQEQEARGMLQRSLAMGGDRARLEAVLAGLGKDPTPGTSDRP